MKKINQANLRLAVQKPLLVIMVLDIFEAWDFCSGCGMDHQRCLASEMLCEHQACLASGSASAWCVSIRDVWLRSL